MPPLRFFCCLALLALAARPLRAQVSATVPLGYFTVTAAAGTGTGATPSVLTFPLQAPASAAGQMAGQVTGVTASTITNANAGWTPGELTRVNTPYVFRFTGGAAAGRAFLLTTVTANDATTVTLNPTDAQNTDLTTLGIVAGDTYQLVPANTLPSVFGTPATTGVLGSATDPNNCDLVQILTPAGWVSYFYDTASAHWRRASLPHTLADSIVVRPDTGVIYSRVGATPLSFTVTGAVPSVGRQAQIANSGPTALSNGWPTDLTLATSSIQTTPGWVANTSPGAADTVQVFDPVAGWNQYFYDGADWRLSASPNTVSDNVAIPAGTMVIINKIGSARGRAVLAQALPYSLVPTQ